MTTDDDEREPATKRPRAARTAPDTPEGRLGETVRRLRRGAGLSQDELAERMTARGVELSQIQMSRLEVGGRPIRLNEAIALAECLHVSAADLVGSVAEAPGTTGAQAAERETWVRLVAADGVWSRSLTDGLAVVQRIRENGAQAEFAYATWRQAHAALGDTAPVRSPDVLLTLDADGHAIDPLDAYQEPR
jgi:transcriptional regulator with XRE-family HTH domain